MIRIHKSTQAPEKLSTDGKKKRKSHCLSYTRNSQDYQSGEKNFSFSSNIYAHKDVKEALIQSQYGKCCFCEQIIYGDGDVEHFRPKQAYRQEKGKPLQRPGYSVFGIHLGQNGDGKQGRLRILLSLTVIKSAVTELVTLTIFCSTNVLK